MSQKPRLLLIPIPKSGTNMFTQAIGGDHDSIHATLIDQHPMEVVLEELRGFNRFARGHIEYNNYYREAIQSNPRTKAVFMYRDPRDMIVSHVHWIKKIFQPGDTQGGFINMLLEDGIALRDSDDPISELIKVYNFHIHKFLPWGIFPWVHLIRYEDMVTDTLGVFNEFLEWAGGELREVLGCGDAKTMMDRVNPKTCSTFRKGIIGDWKNEFTKKHIDLFWKNMRDVMEMLGYE